MRLVVLSLALAGLVLWLIVQSTYGLVARGLDAQLEQPPRAQTDEPADLAAPRRSAQDAASADLLPEQPAIPKRVAQQDPWSLRFVHAGDGTPLRGIEVRIAGTGQAVSTGPEGRCTLPRVPAVSTDLWIDLDGDGMHERTITAATPRAEDVFELDDIYTFEIVQSPENAARYPAAWLAVVRRSDSRAHAPTKHMLSRVPQGTTEAWCHVDMESIPWLMQLDVIVACDDARSRRPLLYVPGTHRLTNDLIGVGDVELRILASNLLDPKVSIYVVQGQQLDLKDTRRSSPGPLTVQWNHVREGKYRITIDSLSHDRWEGEFDAAPPFTPVDAVLVQGPTMRLHGEIAFRADRTYPGSLRGGMPPILIRVSRQQPIVEEYRLNLPGAAIERVGEEIVLSFDFAGIRQGRWSVHPEDGIVENHRFEPSSLTVDPDTSAHPLRFVY